MVILYNNTPRISHYNKKYKTNKRVKGRISSKLHSKQLTTENKFFLTSLGLKVLV